MAVAAQTDASGGTNVTSFTVTAPTSNDYADSGDHVLPATGDRVVVVVATTYGGADTGYLMQASSGATTLTTYKDFFTDGVLANNYTIAEGAYGGDVTVTWPNSNIQTGNVWVAWVFSSGSTRSALTLASSQTTSGTTITSYTGPTHTATSNHGSMIIHAAAASQPITSGNTGKLKYGDIDIAGGTTSETRCWLRFFSGLFPNENWPAGETIPLAASTTMMLMSFHYHDGDAIAREQVHPIKFPTGDVAPPAAGGGFGGGLSIY